MLFGYWPRLVREWWHHTEPWCGFCQKGTLMMTSLITLMFPKGEPRLVHDSWLMTSFRTLIFMTVKPRLARELWHHRESWKMEFWTKTKSWMMTSLVTLIWWNLEHDNNNQKPPHTLDRLAHDIERTRNNQEILQLDNISKISLLIRFVHWNSAKECCGWEKVSYSSDSTIRRSKSHIFVCSTCNM
jgi:hypothetical protein